MLSCFVPFSLEVIYLSFLLTTTKDFKFGCSYLLESRVQGMFPNFIYLSYIVVDGYLKIFFDDIELSFLKCPL
ncbi:hypothetical protein ACS0TY_032782 [Phlomoides rotata]